ncbi:two-component system sensor histidine kinase NtrB [Deferrisoma camini]|uniref:two-component system sensor histidine kinase NtrB n=1 Tax=Deferrisoma camini TaxID=1035120 RepID=UPI00046CFFD4|nr:ATP-binding protein [Deferrisoma camini]
MVFARRARVPGADEPGFPAASLLAATAILGVLLAVATARNLDRERHLMERFLAQEGLTLIRAMEAGARTSLRTTDASQSPVRVLVEETARSPLVAYVWLVDEQGRVVASAGDLPDGGPAPLQRVREVLEATGPVSRLVSSRSGEEIFEVARPFEPLAGQGAAPMRRRWERWCSMGPAGRGRVVADAPACRQAIFVGLHTREFAEARAQDLRQGLILGGVLLVAGAAGLYLVLLSHRVRGVRAALADLESHTRDVIQSLPDALVTLDRQGRVVGLNRRAEELFGTSEKEARGRALRELVGSGACEALETWIGSEEGVSERPAECRAADGAVVPVRVSAAPLTDRHGRRAGTVLLIRDVRELRAAEEQLERSRRLAALGRMAAGLAHEIRNPLGTLRGFAQYFGARSGDDEQSAGYARVMVEEIDRLDRLISALLQFARPREPEPRDVGVASVVERVRALAEAEAAQAGIALRVDVPAELTVRADPDLLTQVLLNLVQNALAATPPGGEVSVAAWEEGDEAAVAVDDTGRGLTPEEREHMFDPFYTTRPTGTGLGLAVVHQIVEQHGGRIQVESIRGRGTRVTVWLRTRGRPFP